MHRPVEKQLTRVGKRYLHYVVVVAKTTICLNYLYYDHACYGLDVKKRQLLEFIALQTNLLQW